MRRSSRRAPAPEPQPAQPAPISTNGLAVDVTGTDRSYAARRAAGQQGLTPQQVLAQQQSMAAHGQQIQQPPAAVQQFPRVGAKNAQPHVPKVSARVGAKHVTDSRGPGTVKESAYRPRMSQPILREHQRNQGNAQDTRGAVNDAAPRTPGVRAPVQPRGPQQQTQARPTPPQAQAQPQVQQAPAPALAANPDAQVASVTAIIATAGRAALLRPQLEALRMSGVVPVFTWVWNNLAGLAPIDRDALMQAQAMVFDTNGNPGGWPRLTSALLADTDYVLMLDDDCIPGADWLGRALDRLQEEDPVIIACEGASFTEDDPTSLTQVGSGEEEVEVDVGLRGWIAHIDILRAMVSIPRAPGGVEGMGLFLGAAASGPLGIKTIVLPTPENDVAVWGAVNEPATPSLSTVMPDYAERIASAYGFYRELGWSPIVVAPAEGEEADGSAEAPEVQATVDPA